jgi:septum site-determining protein MinC
VQQRRLREGALRLVTTAPAPQAAPDMFVTETMAELSARQGRTGDAIAIYRRLLASAPPVDQRRARWGARLAALEEGGGAAKPEPAAAVPPAPVPAAPELAPVVRLPLVVRQPVRSGQIVYAQQSDLIVLAPVSPGAQLLADGNIHVYNRLRGRAVAGVRGATTAQIFCLRLEAELVGIDAAYLVSEDLPTPAALQGRGARVWLEEGRCRVEALPSFEGRPSL